MSVDSNINSYYEELISSIAERAKDYKSEGGVWDGSDEIWQAIDDSLMFYCYQGYILAMAVCRGYISWHKEVNWDGITDMLFDDVCDELKHLNEENE